MGCFVKTLCPKAVGFIWRSRIIIAAIATFFLGKYAVSLLSIKQQYAKLTKAYNTVYVLIGAVILLPLLGDEGIAAKLPCG
jgi:uncharacterized membrane protein